ncbi:MAG: VRR-NUC domain-containing protein [Lachnospiraceae bacterium]|nr:VRR-NUC domain-containing protein [Lachnospiraceae bacterium]
MREIKEIKFMRERDVEQKLRREVEKRGGRCFKFLSSVSGVPDRILLLPGGLVIFVELKKEGEKPRKLQEVQMRKIRELGFRVRVVDSEQEIQELMREIEEEWKS